jgi:hypothetical protein
VRLSFRDNLVAGQMAAPAFRPQPATSIGERLAIADRTSSNAPVCVSRRAPRSGHGNLLAPNDNRATAPFDLHDGGLDRLRWGNRPRGKAFPGGVLRSTKRSIRIH